MGSPLVLVVLVALAGAEGPDRAGARASHLLEPARGARASGTVMWHEAQVPLSRPLSALPWAVVLGASRRASVRVLPFAEVIRIGRRRATVRYLVLVDASATAAGTAQASLLVAEVGEDKPAGRLAVEDDVEARRPDFSGVLAEDVVALTVSHRVWLEEASEARSKLPFGREDLRLDRVTRGPGPGELEPDLLALLRRFSRARAEALAARERLRAIGLHAEDPELRGVAIEALARLDVEPVPEPLREGASVEAALRLAQADLTALRFPEARARLDGLRASGQAEPADLARILVLIGYLTRARGLGALTALSLGQAVCLDPSVAVEPPRPYWNGILEAARASSPCRGEPIRLSGVSAERARVDGKVALRVRARVENDPFRLGAKVVVERFGVGGGRAGEVVAEVDDGGGIEAIFFGDEESLHQRPVHTLRLALEERSGITIARLGEPTPIEVRTTGDVGFSVPGWVWWVAGGLALAGAAVAGGILIAQEDDVQRGIGPVQVDF